MLDNLYISGDLAGLITSYLDKFDVEPSGQRARLQAYDSNRRMTYGQWWEELAILKEHTGKPHVGLEIGSCVAPEHCGVLGYLCLSSNSVMEAALNMERYQRLLYGGTPAIFENNNDAIHCKWLPSHQQPVRESDETLLSGLIHFARLITGNDQLTYSRIGFMHPEPDDKHFYEQFFGCDVFFDSPELCFEGPISTLFQPIRYADPSLQKVLIKQAKDLLGNTDEENDFLLQFKKTMLKAMRYGQPSQKYVSSQLNISTRTLHRRLQENGLLFKTVLESTRAQLAKDYLQANKLTLCEMALLLGYSEQSAFSRAFSSWTGMSPLAYQKVIRKKNN